MKSMLALILIVTTLTSATAWAWDSHAGTAPGRDVIDQSAKSDGVNPADHGLDCMDPCNHGTVHLLALGTSLSTMTSPAPESYIMTNDHHWYSLAPLPLHKPPKA